MSTSSSGITPLPDRGPSLKETVDHARSSLARMSHTPAAGLDGSECRRLLLDLTVLACQVAELELRVLCHAEQVGAGQEVGSPSTASWLSMVTNQSRRSAHAKARLAAAIQSVPRVREALAAGELLPEQARVILEETATAADAAEVVDRLLRDAHHHEVAELRVRGREAVAARSERTDEATASDEPEVARPDGTDETDRATEVDETDDATGAVQADQATEADEADQVDQADQAGDTERSDETATTTPDGDPVRLTPARGPERDRVVAPHRGRPSGRVARLLRVLLRLLGRAIGTLGWHVHRAERCPHDDAGVPRRDVVRSRGRRGRRHQAELGVVGVRES